MTVLWIVLAVVAVTGALVVIRVLARVLAAARQLQQNVESLGESVSAELKRLGGDLAELGDSIDEARRR
jgi:TRAP-type C4-dicarboxylate transport system permease small subunit